MNASNLVWLVSLIAACAVSLMGCKQGNRNAAPESKITGSPSDAPVAIAPKWAAGQRYVMRMESSQSYQLPNFGAGRRPAGQGTNNAPLESTFAQEYSLLVTNASEGQRGIEMEILAVELMAARGEQEFINYDSRNKVARQGGAMTDMFDQFVGGKIYYLVGADNKVVKVEGLNELFARVEPTPESANPNAGGRGRGFGGGGMLRNMYNEDVFKQLIDLAALAPPNSVRVGDTWVTTRDSGAPIIGPLSVTTTNTLRGWQEHEAKKCARVEFTGAVTIGTSTNANPMAAFMRVENGTVKGHSWFAPELGIPIETVVDQKMTINMVNIGAQPRRTNNTANAAATNTPARITLPVNQHISIKLIEVKSI